REFPVARADLVRCHVPDREFLRVDGPVPDQRSIERRLRLRSYHQPPWRIQRRNARDNAELRHAFHPRAYHFATLLLMPFARSILFLLLFPIGLGRFAQNNAATLIREADR